ncbi:MAG TPA: tetratricopeptide repeat protein [Elusimicrobiales bacterium]|nr:tetratricopeptide repeat protein [Elusimicrobiales bacterium]
MRIRKIFNNLAEKSRLWSEWPALLAILFFLLSAARNFRAAGLQAAGFGADNIGSGSLLLAGLYNRAVTWDMPLFNTLAAFFLNLGISPFLFLLGISVCLCLLVFCTAGLLRGWRAGVFSLAALGLLGPGAGLDLEQAFYTFCLMLALWLLLLKRREDTLRNSLLAGLAIGASMLVRSPLFLFPPLVVFCDWACRSGRRSGLLLRSLVFLAASYALLVPWALVRRPLTGTLSLFDDRRAACNIITAARGSIYTMEGNCRELAGPGYDENAAGFFLKEVAKAPFFYALTVLRRLWHIFLFNPLLFGLLAAALLAARGREQRLNFLLPVYFIFIHSLLSVESRYFQPLAYLIAPLATAVLLPRRIEGTAGGGTFFLKAPFALLWLAVCAVAAVEGLIMAYPARAGRAPDRAALLRASARFPGDSVVQRLRCDELLAEGSYGSFYACLEGYSRKFNDKIKGYFLRALAADRPEDLPATGDSEQNIIRMLREFELGDGGAAMRSFDRAYAAYGKNNNALRGTPYARDRELQNIVSRDLDNFRDRCVYDALLLWPPRSIAKILAGMEKHMELGLKLGLLKYVAGGLCPSGGMAACLARRDEIFSGLAREILRPRAGGLALLREKAGGGRPAAAAYLRALAGRPAEGPRGILAGEGVSEAELYKLLELRGAPPGRKLPAAQEILRSGKRPLYYALAALAARESPQGLSDQSLDALEAALLRSSALLRGLSALEFAAGNKEAARRLNRLAEKNFTPENVGDMEKIRLSRELAGSAVEKMRAGAYEPAEKLLAEALAGNPWNPEALMTLCSLYLAQDKKDKALETCQNVSAAVHSNPALRTAAFEMLASEASWTSYKLLKGMGRAAEARRALELAVKKAPAAWPGLGEARRELEGFK